MSARILLVEDNEQNRYLATFLLESAGFSVFHAPDGPTAIEYATKERPDIILMDIQLPHMDGYETATRIRSTPGLESTPLVAVTSYAMPGDRERAMGLGFSGYIEKPIDTDTFVSSVAWHLGGKETRK
jgi:two-component system, cell cycle response regulator DivK